MTRIEVRLRNETHEGARAPKMREMEEMEVWKEEVNETTAVFIVRQSQQHVTILDWGRIISGTSDSANDWSSLRIAGFMDKNWFDSLFVMPLINRLWPNSLVFALATSKLLTTKVKTPMAKYKKQRKRIMKNSAKARLACLGDVFGTNRHNDLATCSWLTSHLHWILAPRQGIFGCCANWIQ